MNKLEALRTLTQVVADTGDIESIGRYAAVDATTNPSLLLKAAQMPQYRHLVEEAIDYAKSRANALTEQTQFTLDKLAVNFGVEILGIVPGRVSSEVDARLSFDTDATIRRAQALMAMYSATGVDNDRILIKIASTWEGIEAGRILEGNGIHCNMTLMFSVAQAVACADAGVTLISPFVGRVLDWYKKAEAVDGYPPGRDPGVRLVTDIYNYYKRHGYETVVMGASFRNIDEILELAGCDLLTIAPPLMEELQRTEGEVVRRLDAEAALRMQLDRVDLDQPEFRWRLNEDAMATEKLAEGIRNFAADTVRLDQFARTACKGCP